MQIFSKPLGSLRPGPAPLQQLPSFNRRAVDSRRRVVPSAITVEGLGLAVVAGTVFYGYHHITLKQLDDAAKDLKASKQDDRDLAKRVATRVARQEFRSVLYGKGFSELPAETTDESSRRMSRLKNRLAMLLVVANLLLIAKVLAVLCLGSMAQDVRAIVTATMIAVSVVFERASNWVVQELKAAKKERQEYVERSATRTAIQCVHDQWQYINYVRKMLMSPSTSPV